MAVESDRVVHVTFNDETLVLRLADGCVLTVPLTWFPRLLAASADTRSKWKVAGNGGHAVHWPDIDEALNVAALLRRRESGDPTDHAG